MNFQAKSNEHPLVLFDGVCNLCNRSVQAIIRRDPSKVFFFVSLQSDTGQRLQRDNCLDKQNIDSVVLIHNQRAFVKSDAALQIFKLLGGSVRFLYVLRIFPRSFRDFVYDWVAKNRYLWFGKQNSCMIPDPEIKDQFLS